MQAGDLLVYKPENLLVTLLDANVVNSGGITRYRVRDVKNKKADTRLVLDLQLRPATTDDLSYVTYLYTDEETGEVHTLTLEKEYIDAIRSELSVGKENAVTAKEVLASIGKKDTDSIRRQFRAAVAYWIERGLLICSTSSGYFIARNSAEVAECVLNKERQANGNLKRAAFLKSMDVDKSRSLFDSVSMKGASGISQ